jgi:hypothetical protein
MLLDATVDKARRLVAANTVPSSRGRMSPGIWPVRDLGRSQGCGHQAWSIH